MKISLHLLLWVLLFCGTGLSQAQAVKPFYVGTYTNGESEGIYLYTFDENSGSILNRQLAIAAVNPSFLAIGKKSGLVLAVNEIADFNNLSTGSISAFTRTNKFSGTHHDGLDLHFNNSAKSNGAHPCHIALNRTENVAVVSNYSGGTVSLHRVKKDGRIAEAFQVIDHNTTEKQSHTHAAQFHKNNLFVADLGLDSFFHYTKKGGAYELRNTFFLGEKSGPRHFEITKNGGFIYVINELNSTVTVLKKKGKDYRIVQQINTLADSFKGESYCADIHISKDQKFLYGSNRGENSIVVFKRDLRTGLLEKIQNISTQGDWPRNFTLTPSGAYLLAANQRSNTISVFKVNKKSGKLKFLQTESSPSPVFLQFLPI